MNKTLSVVFSLLAGWLGLVQSAQAQTLEEALIAAYLNNPTLLAERAKLRAVDEQVPQALSNWRPTMEIESDAGLSDVYSNMATDRTQGLEPYSWSLTLGQSLYRGGRTLAATSEAENKVKAERARLRDVEQIVLLDVVKAYMDVFR
ncbi:MAG: TolC family protein, partial [Rhodospirillales bacterium]